MGRSAIQKCAGVLAAAAVASCAAGFDFESATPDERQEFLDSFMGGFVRGLKFSAGASVEVTRTRADAALKIVAVDLKFTDTLINEVGGEQMIAFRKAMFETVCKDRATQALLFDNGLAIKIAMSKPNGTQLATYKFDSQSCAGYKRG